LKKYLSTDVAPLLREDRALVFAFVPTPYTYLHPQPYTYLHPTPSTLHPTPSTLHPTPSILHPPPSTIHTQPYTLHRWLRWGVGKHLSADVAPLLGEERALVVDVFSLILDATLQGYLAHKKLPSPPKYHLRALGIGLL